MVIITTGMKFRQINLIDSLTSVPPNVVSAQMLPPLEPKKSPGGLWRYREKIEYPALGAILVHKLMFDGTIATRAVPGTDADVHRSMAGAP